VRVQAVVALAKFQDPEAADTEDGLDETSPLGVLLDVMEHDSSAYVVLPRVYINGHD
jgi:hypothetical protein